MPTCKAMSMFETLVSEAKAAQSKAYAPYSHYLVGAAILGADGEIYSGCNVENVSYGLTICAERVAIGKMVAAGCRRLIEVVVVTRDGGTPCGMCRQTLAEFTSTPEEVKVTCLDAEGKAQSWPLSALLPEAFRSEVGPKLTPTNIPEV